MKYIFLNEDNTVGEIVPEFNPVFSNIPIEQRYTADFVAKLLKVDDTIEVGLNWHYNPKTRIFIAPEKYVEPVMLDESTLIAEYKKGVESVG